MVIEDEALLVASYERALRRGRHSIIAVHEGSRAAARAQAERPDLILLDLGVPGLDAAGFIRTLKQDPITADIPVIVVSGMTLGRSVLAQLRPEWIEDVWLKPVRMERLIQRANAIPPGKPAAPAGREGSGRRMRGPGGTRNGSARGDDRPGGRARCAPFPGTGAPQTASRGQHAAARFNRHSMWATPEARTYSSREGVAAWGPWDPPAAEAPRLPRMGSVRAQAIGQATLFRSTGVTALTEAAAGVSGGPGGRRRRRRAAGATRPPSACRERQR